MWVALGIMAAIVVWAVIKANEKPEVPMTVAELLKRIHED